MRWLDGSTDPMDMSLSKLWEIAKDREGWHAAGQEAARSWTELSGWNELIVLFCFFFWLCWASCCALAFSDGGEPGAPLHCSVRASHCGSFSCCRAQTLGLMGSVLGSSQAREHWLSSCGERALVALQHVGSSWTRDRTQVPCVGKWILKYWTTRKVLYWNIVDLQYYVSFTCVCVCVCVYSVMSNSLKLHGL